MNSHRYNDGPTEPEFAPLGAREPAAASPVAGHSIDVVHVLLAHWKLLAAGGLAGLLVGVAFYLFAGHRYDASTRVLVSKLAGMPLQEGEARTYGDRAEHVELIKSDVIVRKAFEKGHLDELPTLANNPDAVRDVIESLKVKRSAGQDQSFLNFFDISYQSSSPSDASAVVNAIVAAYDAYLHETREEQSQEVLNLIADAEGSLKQEIEALKEEYQEFRKSSPILFQTPVGNTAVTGSVTQTPPNHYLATVDQLYKEQRENAQRRTNVQAQMDVLRAMLDEGESRKAIEQYVLMSMSQRTSSADSGSGATNPLLSVNPAKERLDAKLLEARIREANLVHHLGPQHPELEKLRKSIRGIREAYAADGLQPPAFDRFDDSQEPGTTERTGIDLASIYMNYLEEQLRQLDLSDRSIERQLEEAIAQAKKHAEYEVMDKQLSDELQRKQALWDGIVNKLNMVDLTKNQTGFRLTRISDVLVQLSIKRVIKIVGAFLALGVLAVFSWLYYREWQDTTLRTLDDVRRSSGAQLLGVIPHYDAVSSPTGALCYRHDPGSREAEAFRSLRTTLFVRTADRPDHVIQITSPEPGDGKSTSASNLAVAIAQSGRRVLLIDADLRRPMIHQLFGQQQDVGLTEVLQREIEWINAVKATEIPGLSILTSGAVPESPAELLSTSDLSALLQAARQEFEFVLIDTPPMLAVSDPCIIASHVDGLLLVTRLEKNKRPAMARTRDLMETHGVTLYGVIANDLPPSAAAANGYGPYAEYYKPSRRAEGEANAASAPLATASAAN